MPNFRKRLRLKGYDYTKPGNYFITFMTANYSWILSSIEEPTVRLSAIGKIVEVNVLNLPIRYPQITILNYVIMPNHVHLLVSLSSTPDQTPLTTIIGGMKAGCSRDCRRQGVLGKAELLWQDSFHERVIRNEKELADKYAYIDANPGRWYEDKELVREA